jgi:HEPN domain-containing protein
MDVLRLPITIDTLYARGLPRRQLELSCTVKNPAPFDICILDAWIKVQAFTGLNLAEGKLFHPQYALASPAVTHSREECSGVITIELPPTVLHQIEARRAGGDITLRILSRVVACEVRTETGVTTLGTPLPTQFEDGHGGYFEHTIPQSEWVKVLRMLQWSEFELLEFPSRNLQVNPILARALKRLEDAQDCYRRGDWAESMGNCRKAFEALIKDVSGEDKMTGAPKAMRSLIDEEQKAECIDRIVKELGDFLHLARHEQLPPVSIKPEDAEVALRLTGALLVYLGGK